MYDFLSVVGHFFLEKKTPYFSETKFVRVGAGSELRLVSKSSVLGIFRNVPCHDTGTARGTHQILRFLYLILDNCSNVGVSSRLQHMIYSP